MANDLLDQLRARLLAPAALGVRVRYRVGAPRESAVAVVLRPRADAVCLDDLELLLILRAEREGDVWSGHVAMPGGRADLDDPTLVNTAGRETWEEVGLDLHPPHAVLVGALDTLTPRSVHIPSVMVQPFVWWLDEGHGDLVDLALQVGEVADARWVPLRELRDPARQIEHDVRVADGSRLHMRGVQVGLGIPLWGITLRIVEDLSERLGNRAHIDQFP